MLRKKHLASDKQKHKNHSYSQKHIRNLEKILENSNNNGESESGTQGGSVCAHKVGKQKISKK